MFSFNNLFKNYEVKFSENYEGTYSYSKLTNTLTVNAERKADAAADDGNVIASVVVSVPSNLSDTLSRAAAIPRLTAPMIPTAPPRHPSPWRLLIRSLQSLFWWA